MRRPQTLREISEPDCPQGLTLLFNSSFIMLSILMNRSYWAFSPAPRSASHLPKRCSGYIVLLDPASVALPPLPPSFCLLDRLPGLD
uniref:Uncharacterized protein LOC110207701 isoform X2 n=1 Tax=Phascolarctos cinereus TaxID=38626 RepID=A0A6P5K724_PHACI|nr:uncharacterized protein LOC110207701 isoform X2 [Phascolarctos cinereus]